MILELTLPWPPTDNHYYTVAQGRKVLSSHGRAYRQHVAAACLVQLVGVPRPLTTRLCVRVRFHAPDRRLRDIGNLIKALADAMQYANVYANDGQIDEWRLWRCPPLPNGVVHVTLCEPGAPV